MLTQQEIVLQFMLALASNSSFNHFKEEGYLTFEISDIAMELAQYYSAIKFDE
jgi:hypothetical protein